jgi:O-acetyl-ADP-ribose deacetylase (regulator of RNase III)
MIQAITRFFRRRKMQTVKAFGESLPNEVLRITICDMNPDIVTALARVFQDMDNVEILKGDILAVGRGAIVSPANSFGDMGGGLDKAIDDFFNGQAQTMVQDCIKQTYYGEMPVGAASVLPMNHQQYPYLVVAPTMRVPGNVGNTLNAYLAMRAVMAAVLKFNELNGAPIKSVILPCLCTGVGGMGYDEACEQMRTAIVNVLYGQWKQALHAMIAPYPLGPKISLPERLRESQ